MQITLYHANGNVNGVYQLDDEERPYYAGNGTIEFFAGPKRITWGGNYLIEGPDMKPGGNGFYTKPRPLNE